jgi:hypothetical protein
MAAQASRVRCQFLPLDASWPSQIEVCFSILERQALRRARDSAYQERVVALSASGTTPPVPSAGRSRVIPSTAIVGSNFHDTARPHIPRPRPAKPGAALGFFAVLPCRETTY